MNFSPVQLSASQGIGAFSLLLEEDGGLVSQAALEVGFGRRNIEAISRRLPLSQALNYADRVDFLAAPAYNHALACAFEELLGIEVPERAQHIRLILLELNRISSHLRFYGNLARAMGQAPLMNHCLREREKFSDIMEMYCGSRPGFGAICLGGVIEDASDGWFFRIEKAINSARDFLPELNAALLRHPFFVERARGLGVLSAADVARWGISGPNARASGAGLPDARFARPYGAYKKLPPGQAAPVRTEGDVLARSQLRVDEILASAMLIESCFRKIPEGNHRIRVGIEVTPAPGKALSEVEGPRGGITVLAEAEGQSVPAGVQFIGPSAMAVQALPSMLRGLQVEDVFLVIHSLDISFSEVDK